ncbi:MAG: gamma-glutamyl-gamma-aminobutyrate hydrolase family protein [Thermodesulfobacteriota bacterium]
MTKPEHKRPDSRPLIGLTCQSRPGPDWASFTPGQPLDAVFRSYSRGVEAAGGLPVLLPLASDARTAEATISRLDGLLLTGGEDVAPRCYGEEPRAGLEEVDYQRDLMEIVMVRTASRLGLPMLGICRGIQLLNAALGGALYQDLSRQVPGCLEHRQSAPKGVATHLVKIREDTRLASIIGSETIWVNSRHHQAVRDPAPGFIPAAVASDGVIEALERLGPPFVLAVQWHPEGLWSHDQAALKLFSALVEAARPC